MQVPPLIVTDSTTINTWCYSILAHPNGWCWSALIRCLVFPKTIQLKVYCSSSAAAQRCLVYILILVADGASFWSMQPIHHSSSLKFPMSEELTSTLNQNNISHILKEIELQCRGGKETHSNNIFLNSMVAEYCNMHGNHPQNFFFFLGFIILEITMSFYAVVAIHVYNIWCTPLPPVLCHNINYSGSYNKRKTKITLSPKARY